MGGKLNAEVVWDIVWCNAEGQAGASSNTWRRGRVKLDQLRLVPIYPIAKRESSKQRRANAYFNQQETRETRLASLSPSINIASLLTSVRISRCTCNCSSLMNLKSPPAHDKHALRFDFVQHALTTR